MKSFENPASCIRENILEFLFYMTIVSTIGNKDM